jgi:hypothetical protein
MGSFPGSIPLPASFFRVRRRAAGAEAAVRHGDGSNLPVGFRLSVRGLLPSKGRNRAALASASTSAAHAVALATPSTTAAGDPDHSQVSFLGDAKSSLGDAKSSLGDAKSFLGDAKSSLGDAKSFLGDAKSSLGDAQSSLGDAQSSLGDA